MRRSWLSGENVVMPSAKNSSEKDKFRTRFNMARTRDGMERDKETTYKVGSFTQVSI